MAGSPIKKMRKQGDLTDAEYLAFVKRKLYEWSSYTPRPGDDPNYVQACAKEALGAAKALGDIVIRSAPEASRQGIAALTAEELEQMARTAEAELVASNVAQARKSEPPERDGMQ